MSDAVLLRRRHAWSAACVAVVGFALALAVASAATADSGWTLQPVSKPAGAKASALAGVSCASSSECIAVGAYTTATSLCSTGCPLAERWNGASWAVARTPTPAHAKTSSLAAVSCGPGGACTAVGNYVDRAGAARTLAERWNGTDWHIERTVNPPDAWSRPGSGLAGTMLSGVSCASATSCFAVGSYVTRSSKFELTLLEHWNGQHWTLQSASQATGHPVISVSCPSSTECSAAGANDTGSSVSPFVDHWNGSSWISQATANLAVPSEANADDLFDSVSCPSLTDCTAVGIFNNFQIEGMYAGLVERWDGTTWVMQDAPTPSGAMDQDSWLYGVSCASTTACAAVGGYSPNDKNNPQPLVEAWDGTTWTVQQTPPIANAKDSKLQAVSCVSASACFAIGYDSDGVTHTTTALAETSTP
jgi:hypothetical protein